MSVAMNTAPSSTVAPMYMRKAPNLLRISEAQAMTIVTLEPMRTAVLNAPIGMFRYSAPSGQSTPPTRRMT